MSSIEAAKAAINHAQCVCADAFGVPVGDNVDAGNGSPVFTALAHAYSVLCALDPATPPPIQLLVYDESKQHVSVVLHRPGRVDIVPYERGSAKGKLLVYVYDGTSTDERNEPIGCFDGAERTNSGWVK